LRRITQQSSCIEQEFCSKVLWGRTLLEPRHPKKETASPKLVNAQPEH